jgi:hypothetical protein
MPKIQAKGEAAIQKAKDKVKQRRIELFVFYVNGRVRKRIRTAK